jgi:hypothetical protein
VFSLIILGSQDNMSVMIIQFKNGKDYHDEHFKFIPGPLFHTTTNNSSSNTTQYSPLTTKRKLTESEIQRYHSAYDEDAIAAGFTLQQATEKRKYDR